MDAVLVTGGAGYIGSHACKALAASGFLPVTFDNLSTGHGWAVQWGPLERGDILDEALFLQILRKYQPVAVMHFAARAYVGESVERPRDYYRTNVQGTLSLLGAMIKGGVNRFIFSSSCSTYGLPRVLPVDESQPAQPVSPYGFTKVACERMLADFEQAYGLQYMALRYFNAAGADAEGEIGELHEPETHLIPLALMAADGRLPRLEIYGEDYPTPDGTCIRDYVHVSDLAAGHVQSLRALLEGEARGLFNLSTGRGASVREVIEAVERVTGRPVPVAVAPRRPGDAVELVADTTKARQQLGWAPSYTQLDRIVETAWAWMKGKGAKHGQVST
jgi:UDP-arabinose 4-epimerase